MDGDAGDAWPPEGGGVAALPPEITCTGRKNQQLKPILPSPPPPPSKCGKKSRRSMQKRVVSVAVGDGEVFRGKGGGGAGEAFPPSDSWQWRKYGQKPIKGSPHPRGYYRCSSCKGCPARKQVERSRLDPSVLVVAYSFEHNHPWPLHKNARRQPPPPAPPEPAAVVKEEKHYAEEDIAEEEEEEEEPLLKAKDGRFGWFSEVASPCSPSAGSAELLYASVLFGGADAPAGSARGETAEAMAMVTAAAEEEEEEDSLFAGLGELPEYSVVLRRELAAASRMWTDG